MALSALVALLAAGSSGHAPVQSSKFAFHLKGAVDAKLPYIPAQVALSAEKPEGIKKEPTYRTTPSYGVITIGNGPKSKTFVALDEPKDADWKIYIDLNQNGDLTDDGDGAWNKKADARGRTMYGVLEVTLRGSYGDAKREKSSSPASVGLYRFDGVAPLLMYRQSSRNGVLKIDGKDVNAILVENDTDGVYNKKAESVEDAMKSKPVWLMLDPDGKGTYSTRIDIRSPFKIGEKTYEAEVSVDGSELKLKPSNKAVVDLAPKAPPAPPLLKAGVEAPDFNSEKWGGGTLKLSDYRGKIVVLDFWATWCGPCQASMPHVEQVFQKVKDQGVAVVALCVWDGKAEYEKWVPANQSKYSYQFAFDPAGQDSAKSIAGKLYQVSGIPTTYIIDRDGKVADAIVGYQDGDKRVEEALKKLGVKVD